MIRWRSGVVFTRLGIISPVSVLRLLSHQICGHHFGVSGEVTLWPISFGKQTKFPLEVTLRSCRRCGGGSTGWGREGECYERP